MIWDRFMDGALYTSPERWATIRNSIESGEIDAVTLMRNFGRLLRECKDAKLMEAAILNCRRPESVPPFIYYLADKVAPEFRKQLATCVKRSHQAITCFAGRTVILLDMSAPYIFKAPWPVEGLTQGELDAVWATVIRSDAKRVFTASNELVEVSWTPDHGGIDKCLISQQPGRCNIVRAATDLWRFGDWDRVIIFTDKSAVDFHGKYTAPHNHTMHIYSGIDLRDTLKGAAQKEQLFYAKPASAAYN